MTEADSWHIPPAYPSDLRGIRRDAARYGIELRDSIEELGTIWCLVHKYTEEQAIQIKAQVEGHRSLVSQDIRFSSPPYGDAEYTAALIIILRAEAERSHQEGIIAMNLEYTNDLSTEQHDCRHKVPAIAGDLPGDARWFIAKVGWDRRLNTFFLQVGESDPDDHNEIIFDEDHDMHWVGTSWGEIPTVAALKAHMRNGWQKGQGFGLPLPWAELPVAMAEHLEAYQRAMPAERRHRGPFDKGIGL